MSLVAANGQSMIVAGLEVSSRDPLFLATVGVHVLLGLTCTTTGLIAMLSAKRPGRHPRFGSIYYWCLAGVFVTVGALAAVRWREDYHLFILGALAFAAAYLGRRHVLAAPRRHRRTAHCPCAMATSVGPHASSIGWSGFAMSSL